MRPLGTLVKGVVAAALLVGLVVGVPVGLWLAAGWPLPSALPTASQVGDALTRTGIPSTTVVKVVAVVAWVAWVRLVVAVVAEVVVLVRHRPGPTARTGSARGLARALVTASVTLLGAVSALRPAGATTAARPPVVSVAQPRLRSRAGADERATAPRPTWTVRTRDTLWGVAEVALGRGERWREIEHLNRGRLGGLGADNSTLRPGTMLLLPDDARVPERRASVGADSAGLAPLPLPAGRPDRARPPAASSPGPRPRPVRRRRRRRPRSCSSRCPACPRWRPRRLAFRRVRRPRRRRPRSCSSRCPACPGWRPRRLASRPVCHPSLRRRWPAR